MDIADNKHDLRIIRKHTKDMTPLFGQFAAYMMKINTFGFTKVLIGDRRNFFPKQSFNKSFPSALSISYVFVAYLFMCTHISIGCSGFGKNCDVAVDMSKMSIRTWFPITYSKYTNLILSMYINTKYVPIYNSRANLVFRA